MSNDVSLCREMLCSMLHIKFGFINLPVDDVHCLWLAGVSKNDLLFAIKAEVLARLPLTT